jgi:flagellar biosynthesis/type III secretory pathway M-ring protein FliF/YscJ
MKLLTLLFLLCTIAATAQLSEKQLKELHDNTAKIESTTTKLNESINASIHRTDSMNMVRFNEQNSRNLDAFMAARKEQERKTTQRIYWRLGFGVLMLIVLFVGWRRKKNVKV